nr:glutamate synthase [Clostridium sp.]
MRRLEKKDSMNKRIDVVLRKFRSRMNSYPPGMCPLSLYRSLLQISINQSCGKCVPCREGLPRVERLLQDILRGDASMETLQDMEKLCVMIENSSDC